MRKTFSLPVAATAAGGGVTPPPADTVDNIEHSVRFNRADNAYLSRTPSSAGNRKTWTWSGWVKRSALGDWNNLFWANGDGLRFKTDDKISFVNTGVTVVDSTAVFRDTSAWYHVVCSCDTTLASNMVKIYVNNELVAQGNCFTQNEDTDINNTTSHVIGAGQSGRELNGYLANIELIDGQALTPSSFGFTDSNGVWQPKAYTGSYGTNGFHLDFADTSSATALGNDVSGNNNDWTPSGLVAGPAYTANSFSTEFDGSGDYLSIPDSNDLDLGTGDFTIELWVNPASLPANAGLIGKRGSSFSSNSWRIAYTSANNVTFLHSDDVTLASYEIPAPSLNTWTHYAFSRESGTLRMFKNGTEEKSVSFTFNLDNTNTLEIGANTSSATWNGKISNLRVIKGRALYTAAFTPPSTALTAVTDTVLLTCQDSTFIDNSPSAHTITAVNDAATTTVSPFEPVDGSDAMLDSPTNYGSGDTVRGNYCTLNPLITVTGTLSNGNLDFSSGAQYRSAFSTFAVTTGKWYIEGIVTNFAADALIGIASGSLPTGSYLGSTSTSWSYAGAFGHKWNSGSNTVYGSTFTTNDVIGVAFDADTGKLWFSKNGVWQASGDPASGANPAFTVTVGASYFFGVSGGSAGAWTCNFGQQPFKYPLAGYKSLCSTNLPTPAIADGSTAMDVALYTGNGGTQSISTPNISPDLVWIKRRDTTGQHVLTDIVRGTNSQLYTSSTSNEGSDTTVVTAFNSAGFELGSGPVSFGNTNTLNSTYAAWTWDAGSSTVSNTDGTITSQVRANPSAGFSIVSYTGTGANATIGHGLNAVPEMIIVKNRDAALNWNAYHVGVDSSSPEDYFLRLNFTDAIIASVKRWNNTAPTSSVFSVGTSGNVNGNTQDLIAYCFAPVEGFSSFGSYTGNGSNDGPFVYTGFRPRYLLIKGTSLSHNWYVFDSSRDSYNGVQAFLNPPGSNAESTAAGVLYDFTSNGFKLRSGNGELNGNSYNYIYAAFAEHPFKTSRAR